MRVNTHDLPEKLRIIVQGVITSPIRFDRRQLSRKYGGPNISRLIEGGYLTESLTRSGRQIEETPLAKAELEKPRPWKKEEIKYLCHEWPRGGSTIAIAQHLTRTPADVTAKIAQLGLERKGHEWRRMLNFLPAWRRRRLRLALIEAERRGIDPQDPGDDLYSRALLRRFYRARIWSMTISATRLPRWPTSATSALRLLRDQSHSIAHMARALDRTKPDVAQQLQMIGRSINAGWSLIEDKIVIEGIRDGLSYSMIAARLPNKDVRRVKSRALKLCPPAAKHAEWTPNEIRALLDGAARGLRGTALSACVPTRSHHAVRRKFYKLTRNLRTGDPLVEVDFHVVMMAMRRGDNIEDMAKWLGRDVHDLQPLLRYFISRIENPTKPYKLRGKRAEQAVRMVMHGRDPHIVAKRFGVGLLTLKRTVERAGETFPRDIRKMRPLRRRL